MKKIHWTPEFSVGVRELDEQHKRIVLMLNRLIGANEVTTGSHLIADLITQMIAYANEHFRTEEDLLIESGYPLFSRHRQFHIDYRKKVTELCTATPLGVPDVPRVMLDYLVQWWRIHILREDMEYKAFFNEKGIY